MKIKKRDKKYLCSHLCHVIAKESLSDYILWKPPTPLPYNLCLANLYCATLFTYLHTYLYLHFPPQTSLSFLFLKSIQSCRPSFAWHNAVARSDGHCTEDENKTIMDAVNMIPLPLFVPPLSPLQSGISGDDIQLPRCRTTNARQRFFCHSAVNRVAILLLSFTGKTTSRHTIQ